MKTHRFVSISHRLLHKPNQPFISLFTGCKNAKLIRLLSINFTYDK